MMLGPTPMSENIWRPDKKTVTKAISPKDSGANKCASTRFETTRRHWPRP